jgi:uncharacterized membrane protein
MRLSWVEFRRTFITVILTIVIIWILKEINDRYNLPVIGTIIEKGA